MTGIRIASEFVAWHMTVRIIEVWLFFQLKIKKLERRLEKTTDDIDKQILQQKISHKKMMMEQLERNIYNCKREFTRFYQQAALLKEKIGDLTPEKRRRLDQDMWLYRVKEMIAIDFLQMGRMKNTTVEFLTVLPRDMRDNILRQIGTEEGKFALMDNYLNRDEVYTLPFEDMELPQLKMEIIEKLLEYNDAKETKTESKD